MLTLEFLLDALLLNPGEMMALPELLFDELEEFYELAEELFVALFVVEPGLFICY
jgi:hypothetical protein